MPLLPRFRLSDAEKDALLAQQQDLIEQLACAALEGWIRPEQGQGGQGVRQAAFVT